MQRLYLAFALLLFFSVQLANGQQSIGKESLSHLDGIRVIASVSKDAENEGLLKENLKTNTELQLRKAGIEVYTKENFASDPAAPGLLVAVSTLENDGLFAYNLSVNVSQKVITVDGTETSATTYETIGQTGMVGGSNIRDLADTVRQEVRIFINDWLSVHQ